MSTKSSIFQITPDPQIHFLRKHRRETASFTSTASLPKKLWWKNAVHFFKRRWVPHHCRRREASECRARASASVPLYITESRSGSGTPCRSVGRSARNWDFDVPYMSLRELNMEPQHQIQRVSISAMPIYLVT